MDNADTQVGSLKREGAKALRFNAPMSIERATSLAHALVEHGPDSVVDLGCGRGAMARLIADAAPDTAVLGVDNDRVVVNDAIKLAEAADLTARPQFEVADAATWNGDVDAAVCIGASHVFGPQGAMISRLANLVATGVALIGDGIWDADPNEWCREAFGELPHGLTALADLAVSNGWTVELAEQSSLDEWDSFEHGWVEGVRSVGSAEALNFADTRQADYANYRGVLGFGWLLLRR